MQRFRSLLLTLSCLGVAAACSSKNSLVADAGSHCGAAVTCASEAAGSVLTKNQYAACTSCQEPMLTPPVACSTSRPIDACCAFVQAPTVPVQAATGLHYNSGTDPNAIDFSCLDTPAAQGTPQMVTLVGDVKLFAAGEDSAGVKIEVFQEGPSGSLGPLVGTAVVTMATDPYVDPKPTWSTKCPTDGCTLRKFTYPNIPTETPLIIKTSDANNAQKWSELYDYNIYFSNSKIGQNGAGMGQVFYEPSAVAATDPQVVAATVGGTVKADKGLLAGEVHDCNDVRLSGATVYTDYRPENDSFFYFTDNESDPTPDQQRTANGSGTSKLGLFGGLNYQTGVPVRVSAVAQVGGGGGDGGTCGSDVLAGTYVVQMFPGAVTALSFRGRRPYQK